MATGLTLRTVQEYVTDARTMLLDSTSPYRYDDNSLLTALNLSLYEARRLRPDLFIYNEESDDDIQEFLYVTDQEVKMERPFRLAILLGMVGHALARDQENVEDARAASFMGAMQGMLTGVVTPPIKGGTTGR